jgi:uncharacterized SAM-dependent methyltransferase
MTEKEGQKINDLIFRELIKRGYSLEGNTRIWNIADSKLWYLTPEQAQAYLNLENEEEYKKTVIQQEIDLINKNIKAIRKKFENEPINIIDIGCGDGQKAALLVEQFKGAKVRYCPIDISSYMVNKAIGKIRGVSEVKEVIEFQWNISNFENMENISTLLRQGKYKKNLFLLLGNTLGNFEINELLYEIRNSMKGGDFLLIGNGLDNSDPEEILKSYNTAGVNEFLIHIPLQLGLPREDIELGARFANSRVELYYKIKKATNIKFQGKEVIFNKNDQILVSVSYKYNKEDFTSFLNLYFDDIMVKSSKDESYAIALCKK